MSPKSIPRSHPPPEVGDIPIYRNGSAPQTTPLEPVDAVLLREGVSDDGNEPRLKTR